MVKKNFNEWLDKELEKRNWDRAELARRANVSQASLSLIKTGNRNPTPEIASAIARALHESPETVFRAAGLLPSIDPIESELEDFRELLKNLTPEERSELKAIGWLKVDLKKRNK